MQQSDESMGQDEDAVVGREWSWSKEKDGGKHGNGRMDPIHVQSVGGIPRGDGEQSRSTRRWKLRKGVTGGRKREGRKEGRQIGNKVDAAGGT